MENIISEVVSGIREVTALAQPQTAAQHVPTNARFATIATVMLIDDPNQTKLHFSVGTGFGPLTESSNLGMNGTKYTGYLYHDGTSLVFATESQVIYTFPLTSITGINNSYSDFFLVLLPNNQGLLVGQLVPIQFPAGNLVRSSPNGVTDNTMGWYKEFVSLGVVSQQQAQVNARSGKLFLIVFIIAFIGLTVFILSR